MDKVKFVKDITESIRKEFVCCQTCRKAKVWPFQLNAERFPVIRCERCQRELNKVWFASYQQYIDTFKGQV